jgi:DNA topoisomerase I
MVKKALVIVESPSKAKTIQKYLGREYIVKASVGHIKDLPKSKLGVDPKKGFEPDYQVIPGKVKVIDELKKASQKVLRFIWPLTRTVKGKPSPGIFRRS